MEPKRILASHGKRPLGCAGNSRAYLTYCQKFYEKQGNNMKPQSYTEGFSVFSNRISFNGNNRGIEACL
jgi:hypothetical protein